MVNPRQDMLKGVPFYLTDYCELVDITGKIVRHDKAGHIDHQQQPTLAKARVIRRAMALTSHRV